jgi:hypothetical protein
MLQLKIGLGAAALAVAGHTAYVVNTRMINRPTGRLLQFSPGSQDEVVAFSLKTGDLILFRRDCSSYPLVSGVSCLVRQSRLERCATDSESVFDHMGVIVLLHGKPHVLEMGTFGPRLRPYDARIKLSLSKKILVRQLRVPLSKAASRELEQFASKTAARNERRYSAIVADLAAACVPTQPQSTDVALVEEAYASAGLLPAHAADPPVGTAGAGAVRGTGGSPTRWWPPEQPFQTLGQPHRFGADVWVRDLR